MSERQILLHVAVSFWFVAGLLGRNVTMARADLPALARREGVEPPTF